MRVQRKVSILIERVLLPEEKGWDEAERVLLLRSPDNHREG